MAPRRSLLPLVALVLGTAGCGQSADRDAVRVLTQRFLAAYQAQDGAAACDALSQATRKELEGEEGKACAQALPSLQLDGGAVTRVHVYLTNAKVDLASGESLFLSEERSGWRLSAVGCQPQGKPADRPYDCELQA